MLFSQMGPLATRAITVVAVTLCYAFTSILLLPQVISSVLRENSTKCVHAQFSILLPELHPLAIFGSTLKVGTNLQFLISRGHLLCQPGLCHADRMAKSTIFFPATLAFHHNTGYMLWNRGLSYWVVKATVAMRKYC